MSDYYKFLGTEINLPTSANTISNSSYVRIANPTGNAHVVTHEDPVANVTVATFTVRPNSEFTLKKRPTDTVKVDSGTDLKIVPCAS